MQGKSSSSLIVAGVVIVVVIAGIVISHPQIFSNGQTAETGIEELIPEIASGNEGSLTEEGGEAMEDSGDAMEETHDGSMTEGESMEETGSTKPSESLGITAEATAEVVKAEEPAGATTHTVNMDADGFTPATLTIKKGDTVSFVATGGSNYWPASNVHPSHTIYPGSSISKCGGDEETTIFDSCGGIESLDDPYEFTFDEVGTWNYHDHLKPSKTGSITVEE